MPDCGKCGRPLGGQLRRDRNTGECEDEYSGDPRQFAPFTPAELGLDPDDYDLELWNNAPPRLSMRR